MILKSYSFYAILPIAILFNEWTATPHRMNDGQQNKEWDIIFDEEFQLEFDAYEDVMQANMKELRAPVGKQVWRIAYAFDPHRRAILLCAGNKEGGNSRKFYAELIAAADDRFGKYK